MKIATATIVGLSDYSQSKFISVDKKPRELPKDYEERNWRERCHYGTDGRLFVPAMSFKNCLAAAAKFMSEQVPGKGKATYTKHFLSGVLVMDNAPLPVTKDDVEGEWFFVPSDGKRGGGSRVHKCFPVVRDWRVTVQFHILDDIITEDVFKRTLMNAGNYIGIGRFRPENGGYYGRFRVEGVKWEEVDV